MQILTKNLRCRFYMQTLTKKKTWFRWLTYEQVQENTFPTDLTFASGLSFLNLPTIVKQSDKDKLKGNVYHVFACGRKLSLRYHNYQPQWTCIQSKTPVKGLFMYLDCIYRCRIAVRSFNGWVRFVRCQVTYWKRNKSSEHETKPVK